MSSLLYTADLETKIIIMTFIINFGIISLRFILSNGYILIKQIKKEECPSVCPFFGGVAGVLIVILAFEKKYWGLIFIPLLLDYGSIPIICKFIYLLVTEYWDERKNE